MADTRNLGAGLFFAALGLVYGWMALTGLSIGEATNMGPGYFPTILSGILMLIGALLIGRSFMTSHERAEIGVIAWRAVLALTVSTLVFAMTLRPLGVLPATFLVACISAAGSKDFRPARASGAAIIIAMICTLIFVYGLKLPVRIFGTWFG